MLVKSEGDELSEANFVSISNQVLTVAESFTGSVTLATLDAIHVATAITLGHQILQINNPKDL